MNKVILIIKREYLSRVKKRSFIVMTLLGPILFAGLMIAAVFVTQADSVKHKIMVVDDDGVLTRYDEQRGVHVDDFLQTRNRNIYAAGDVCMQHKFTHAADFAARAVIQNALFSLGPFGRRRLSSLNIPWCTYTDPEIAHVGLYEREAVEQGIDVDTYVREFSTVDRSIAESRTTGFAKIHTRRGGDRIHGATIVAHSAGDLISEISVAMAGKIGLGALGNGIHPYPTNAGALAQLGGDYNRTRLTPTVKKIFEGFLAWRR